MPARIGPTDPRRTRRCWQRACSPATSTSGSSIAVRCPSVLQGPMRSGRWFVPPSSTSSPGRSTAWASWCVLSASLAPASKSGWRTSPITSSVWLGSKDELRRRDAKTVCVDGSDAEISGSAPKTRAHNPARALSPCHHAEIRRFFEVSSFLNSINNCVLVYIGKGG